MSGRDEKEPSMHSDLVSVGVVVRCT